MINPGNSGGALCNEYDEVVGIATAKTSALDIAGLGFAMVLPSRLTTRIRWPSSSSKTAEYKGSAEKRL
jgi:hypothetical protein